MCLLHGDPCDETLITTSAPSLDLAGTAAALRQTITQVSWTNTLNKATGLATGTNVWAVTSVPLVADKTHVVMLTATTTRWAPAFGGNTTFNDTLTVFDSPIRATIALQGSASILNWTGAAPPYAVQHATDLVKGDWTDLLINANPPVSLPMESGVNFYRIVGK